MKKQKNNSKNQEELELDDDFKDVVKTKKKKKSSSKKENISIKEDEKIKEKEENNQQEPSLEIANIREKMNIDEEIKAIKEKKKGNIEIGTLKEEKKEIKENKEVNKNDLDIFSMIEDEDTIEIKNDIIKTNIKDTNKDKEEVINNFEISNQEIKIPKSKFSIFLLILSLLAIIYYGVYVYLHTDFSNIVLIELVKALAFILVSLLIIMVLFKVNNKKTTPYVFLLTLVLIGYTLFTTSYSLPINDNNYVLDFVNKDITEVMDWAKKNNLELEILHEFSDTVLKNHVIMQEYNVTTLVNKVKSPFKVTVSDGPNYDKSVTISNLTGFTFDEVMAYIKENNLNNVEIEFMVSDALRDTVIEQIGSGTLKRNDKIIFKFSYGNEEIEKIPVKDLKNLSEFEATAYLKRYNIPYEVTYEYANIEKGYVIKQSVVDAIVTDKLILTVSKGAEITIPNFLKMSTTEISKWAMQNNINITFEEKYNKDYASGKVIASSKAEGEKVNEGEVITITISKGSMTMPKIENLAEFKLWANENNVKYQEVYEFSNELKGGEIIKTEPQVGSPLSENDTIVITISRGKQITIPNFIGMSKSNIQARCNSINIVCSFNYGEYTDGTARDIALRQSKGSGTVVAEGTNVTITLSSGIHEKVNVPSFTGKTKNQISSSCNEIGIVCNFIYNNDFSNEARDTAIRQDKSGTVYKGDTVTITLSQGPAKTYDNIIIDGSLLTQGNPEQTKNTLKNLLEAKCPGVTFVFSFKAVNNGIGYLNENSQVKVGSNTFVQGKTYQVIINASA